MRTKIIHATFVLLAGCSATPSSPVIASDPATVVTSTSTPLLGGSAWWTSDALIIELRESGLGCASIPLREGEVSVSITVPRALAAPGEMPVQSNILDSTDVDVGVLEVGPGTAQHSSLLTDGSLRLDAVGDSEIVGGLVGRGTSSDPSVDGIFTVPNCGER